MAPWQWKGHLAEKLLYHYRVIRSPTIRALSVLLRWGRQFQKRAGFLSIFHVAVLISFWLMYCTGRSEGPELEGQEAEMECNITQTRRATDNNSYE